MSRLKKFLYLYFSIILGFLAISVLGDKTVSGEPIIEYFFNPLAFTAITLMVFIASLFL